MGTLTATVAAFSTLKPPVISDGPCKGREMLTGPSRVRSYPKFHPLGSGRMKLHMKLSSDRRQPVTRANRMRSASTICYGALNATCSAVETHPTTKKPQVISKAPIRENMRPPQLDDGGTGFPPRDDGGGGGGGGGGGSSSGGFILFGVLLFLRFLKDQEMKRGFADD